MASALSGKWKVVSTDNVGAFFKSLGYSDEAIKASSKLDDVSNDLVDEISITDTGACIISSLTGTVTEKMQYVFGTPVDHEAGGIKSKLTMVVENGGIKTTQQGDGFSATYLRQASGDDMTITMTSGQGVVATRKLKKIA